MYRVLDKDTINMEILPHLSVAKRGYTTKNHLVEIVNAILYKFGNRHSMGKSPGQQSVFVKSTIPGRLRRFYRSIHF